MEEEEEEDLPDPSYDQLVDQDCFDVSNCFFCGHENHHTNASCVACDKPLPREDFEVIDQQEYKIAAAEAEQRQRLDGKRWFGGVGADNVLSVGVGVAAGVGGAALVASTAARAGLAIKTGIHLGVYSGQLSKIASKGLPSDQFKNTANTKHVGIGLRDGVTNVVSGIAKGAAKLVSEPVEGARRGNATNGVSGGIKGAAVGVAKGVGQLGIFTVTGVATGVDQVVTGLVNTPRSVYKSIKSAAHRPGETLRRSDQLIALFLCVRHLRVRQSKALGLVKRSTEASVDLPLEVRQMIAEFLPVRVATKGGLVGSVRHHYGPIDVVEVTESLGRLNIIVNGALTPEMYRLKVFGPIVGIELVEKNNEIADIRFRTYLGWSDWAR
eukprot:c9630_g1_i2.p1 GENE.c9630_g1_i2~~c9630_g1_i2.p1  ORF type:complete len:404 (+),score=85.68 c9630_g1_i2:67-1212(+)